MMAAVQDDSGTLIQGRYRLQEIIGRGGMGQVWRALDESLGRRVAVKCLKPMSPGADAGFTRVLQERFRREARVAAALQHRGVTVVHDFGEYDGALFLVMELLDGRNLLQVLNDAGRHPLPLPDVLDIAEQVSAALAYTHAQGIVHRDLKPANIIRLPDGTVKICDFGIARLGHDIGFTSRLTGTGIAMGTPHYMSPEQIGGSEVDHRSDLYSLGCVLYEIVTGRPPFDDTDAWAVLVAHRDTQPESPRARRPELSLEMERLILDLLGKDADDRPQDTADVCGRLKAIRAAADRPAYGDGSALTGGSAIPLTGAHGAVPVSSAPALAPLVGGPAASVAAGSLPLWAARLGSGSAALSTGIMLATAAPQHALTGAWSTLPHRGPTSVASHTPATPTGLEGEAALEARHREAVDLAAHGRWQQAYEIHIAVAAARDRVLGAEHPDTIGGRHEAAHCLARLGRSEDALRLYEYVAGVRQRVLGPDHPATLDARQDTAYALGRLGRHLEAQQVYAAVLAVRERTAGPEHPDTLRCRHGLVCGLGRLGRIEEACALAVELAAVRVRVLGVGHPDTLRTRYEAGHLLGRLGRWAEALEAYQDVAVRRAHHLGPGHPDTLAAEYEMGICLGRLGRGADALELYRRLVEARTRAGGAADAETLRARHALGVNLGRLGRWEQALAEAREVEAVRERVLGAEHPDTLVSKREIAVGLGWLGRWDVALETYRQVADARERVLGPAHPDTLTSRNDEAHCLEQLGRTAEAQALYRKVADQQQGAPQRL